MSDDGTEEIGRDSNDVNDEDDNAVSATYGGLDVLPPSLGEGSHSQMLLHSLLEDWCLNQVRQRRRNRDCIITEMDEISIEAEARQKYCDICTTLYPHVSPGFEHDHLSPIRQAYRDGLSVLSQAQTARVLDTSDKSGCIGRLGAGSKTPKKLSHSIDALVIAAPRQLGKNGSEPISAHNYFLEPNRYRMDFDELSILGKGGYGTVFRVKHKLDGVQYAVKKIPISDTRLARLCTRGEPERVKLLRELHTLARLDHPNIVRYYNGWIEWSDKGENVTRCSDGVLTASEDTSSDAIAGDENEQSRSLLGQNVTHTGSIGDGIIFENSGSSSNVPSQGIAHRQAVGVAPQPRADQVARTTDRVLAIHLQMGLYPLTLADFLLSRSSMPTGEGVPLAHCFHLQASLAILVALLDGVEYLHTQGICHRDLKPANVFLAANHNPRNSHGTVDLLLCNACRAEGQAHSTVLNVRIGDFGLVTALAPPGSVPVEDATPIGTELYRPLRPPSNASAVLDVFALGIMAFELLWPFSTRKSGKQMPRYHALTSPRHGAC